MRAHPSIARALTRPPLAPFCPPPFAGPPPQAISILGGFLSTNGLEGANCTVACPAFLECVHDALIINNKSAAARERCITTPAGQTCTARTKAYFTERTITEQGVARIVGYDRTGFRGICVDYECFDCVVRLYAQHFTCAVTCLTDPSHVECIDCSYTYDNSHQTLLELEHRLWEGYFLGALGDYAVADLLHANYTSCALSGERCLVMANYEVHVKGIGDAPSYYNTGVRPELETSYTYGT